MATLYSVEVSSNKDFTAPAKSGAATSSVSRFLDQLKAIVSGSAPASSLRFLQSQSRASGTVTMSSLSAGSVVSVNNVPFRAVASGAVAANNEFNLGADNTAAATNLAALINGSSNSSISGIVSAASSGAVVTITSLRPGRTANAIPLSPLGVVANATVTVAGVLANDTLTVNGVTLTALQRNATGTVAAASAANGDSVTIGGVTFTGLTAGSTPAAFQFAVGTGGSANTDTATNLAAAINGVSGLAFDAVSSGVTVTVRAVTAGTAGNSITLASSNATTLAVSGTVLAGGSAVAINTFDPGGSNTQVATNIAACVNASTSTLVSDHVYAVSNGALVTLLAKSAGVAGNLVTIASSNGSRLAVPAGGRLASGAAGIGVGIRASGTISVTATSGTITCTINGVAITTTAATNTATAAASLATAINSSTDALVLGVVDATAATGVITVRAAQSGVAGNSVTLDVTAGTGTASGARLTGGQAPAGAAASGSTLSGGSTGETLSFSY